MLFVMKNANQHTYHGKKGVQFKHQLSHNILHWRRQLIYIFLIILALQANQIIALISRSTHQNNIDYIKMRKYETTQFSKKRSYLGPGCFYYMSLKRIIATRNRLISLFVHLTTPKRLS